MRFFFGGGGGGEAEKGMRREWKIMKETLTRALSGLLDATHILFILISTILFFFGYAYFLFNHPFERHAHQKSRSIKCRCNSLFDFYQS